MKKEIFSLAWSEFKPYSPYFIGAIILMIWLWASPVNINDGKVDEYHEAYIESQAKLEVYLGRAKEDSVKIVKLQKELDIIKASKDSLGVIVDNIVPGVVGTIQYISTPGATQAQIDSARAGLLADFETAKLERKTLKETVIKQDQVIAAQYQLIADLNKGIEFLQESNANLANENKQLRKLVRKEVRKRRLSYVVGAAAVAGVILLSN